MSTGVWSCHWAEEIAELFGLSRSDEVPAMGSLNLAVWKQRLAQELGHLPLESVQRVLNSARENASRRPPNSPAEWEERLKALDRCIKLAEELRRQHGLREATDEGEAWTEEDRCDATQASAKLMQNEAGDS